jgi:predicted nucleotidyltransferase
MPADHVKMEKLIQRLAMRTLDEVRSYRKAILQLAKKYGIRRVRVFGSVVRQETTAESDVDILVDFEPGRSLLDQVGFEQDLQALLGCKVEVLAEGGISPHLESRILQEAVPL